MRRRGQRANGKGERGDPFAFAVSSHRTRAAARFCPIRVTIWQCLFMVGHGRRSHASHEKAIPLTERGFLSRVPGGDLRRGTLTGSVVCEAVRAYTFFQDVMPPRAR